MRFPRYHIIQWQIMLLSYVNAKNDGSLTKPHPLETKLLKLAKHSTVIKELQSYRREELSDKTRRVVRQVKCQ